MDNRTEGRLSKRTDSVSFPRDLGQVCLLPAHSPAGPAPPSQELVCTLPGEMLSLDTAQLLSYWVPGRAPGGPGVGWRLSLTQGANSPRPRASGGASSLLRCGHCLVPVSETGSRLPEPAGGALGPVRGSCSTFAVAEM